MSSEQLSTLKAVARVSRTYRTGEEIFGEGESVAGAYKVVSGAVRSCKYLGDGRRQVLGFHLVDEIFGFEPGGEHTVSAEAVMMTAVAVTPVWSVGDPDALVDLFASAADQLKQANDLTVDLGRKLAHERVASFFLDLARRGQRTSFALPMPRGDIADYLGLTGETVSRVLMGFNCSGLIRLLPYAKRVDLLDLTTLCELADGGAAGVNFGYSDGCRFGPVMR